MLVVQVQAVFFQCARAIQRSRLWDAAVPRRAVTSAGAILEVLTDGVIEAGPYDAELPARQAGPLY